MTNGKRAVNLDFLKMIAAIMIIVLHYNGYSGNLMVSTASNRTLFCCSESLGGILHLRCQCFCNDFLLPQHRIYENRY